MTLLALTKKFNSNCTFYVYSKKLLGNWKYIDLKKNATIYIQNAKVVKYEEITSMVIKVEVKLLGE